MFLLGRRRVHDVGRLMIGMMVMCDLVGERGMVGMLGMLEMLGMQHLV